MLNALAWCLSVKPKHEHSSFTAWTTRVSNPVCSPRLRISASVLAQMIAFASGIPPNIYGFHPYTRNSIIPYQTLAKQYRMQFLSWAQGFHSRLTKPPTYALRPVIPNNASTLRITAAAGTKLAGAFSVDTVIIFSTKRALQPEGRHHPRGIAGSGFRPLSNIPHCCLP